ncbi:MAG: transcriptional regulator NrdR [Clostridia bacterium]|nr:transcriptional regulator NrdR [Clostridia bacterium]
MRCQFCSCRESKVIDSRPTDEGVTIRRRRACLKCGRRFTTYEKVELKQLLVIKKDGRRESFEGAKIRGSILRACEKRSVSAAEIDAMVSRIEQAAYAAMEEEIPTYWVGEQVMRELRERDQVAYVRFASVYRQFTDISSFMDELTKMLTEQTLKRV